MIRKIGISISAACLFSIGAAVAQDLGDIQSYGQDGRLFSKGNSDYYLLTRQSAGTDDSAGFVGQVRIVKKYAGGGYEEVTENYMVRCKAINRRTEVMTFKQEEKPDSANLIEIDNPDRKPSKNKIAIYNLYWATCREQFAKFR